MSGDNLSFRLYLGDCLDVLDSLPENSVDSVVTDPPYDLVSIQNRFAKPGSAPAQEGTNGAFVRMSKGFMGATWDGEGIAFRVDLWQKVMRVLKPGGFLLAFGGTRTYHRMACAIEDAGFEIRDSLHWVYGSGFPKARALGTGWATALKPSHEPVVMARKPISEGGVAANVLRWGTGGLNIDAGRVETDERWKTSRFSPPKDVSLSAYVSETHPLGRWPANTVLGHAADCKEGGPCAPHCPCSIMDAQSGKSRGGVSLKYDGLTGPVYGMGNRAAKERLAGYNDEGGASRFFARFYQEPDAPFYYCPKPGRAETEAGLSGFDARQVNDGRQTPINNAYQMGEMLRLNTHPTKKPVALIAYLQALVTPPGGVTLDPFMGSGTAGVAAARKGFRFIGIEREPEYFAICEARIAHAAGPDAPVIQTSRPAPRAATLSLFDDVDSLA